VPHFVNLSHMRALVWANSVGVAIFGVLVPVVWIRPWVVDLVIWWCLPAVLGVVGISALASVRHLRYRLLHGSREPDSPSSWMFYGWRQTFALLKGVPRRGVALGLSSGVVAWLVGTAAAVAEMTGLPGPDVAVVFVALPVFALAVTALFVAAAMAERDQHRVASDSS
jgi:hypothetical protein